MRSIARFSPLYRSAVRDALVIQVPLILLCGAAADYGLMGTAALRAALAFWIGAAVIIARRPLNPSPWDFRFFRFGYLALLPASVVLMHAIPEQFRW